MSLPLRSSASPPPTTEMDLPPARLLVYSPTPYSFPSVLSTLLARDVSPQLSQSLAPKLFDLLQTLRPRPSTYLQLLDLAKLAVQSLPLEEQAYFLASQPRIGERYSAAGRTPQEQDSLEAPGEVLKRLTVSTRRHPTESQKNIAASLLVASATIALLHRLLHHPETSDRDFCVNRVDTLADCVEYHHPETSDRDFCVNRVDTLADCVEYRFSIRSTKSRSRACASSPGSTVDPSQRSCPKSKSVPFPRRPIPRSPGSLLRRSFAPSRSRQLKRIFTIESTGTEAAAAVYPHRRTFPLFSAVSLRRADYGLVGVERRAGARTGGCVCDRQRQATIDGSGVIKGSPYFVCNFSFVASFLSSPSHSFTHSRACRAASGDTVRTKGASQVPSESFSSAIFSMSSTPSSLQLRESPSATLEYLQAKSERSRGRAGESLPGLQFSSDVDFFEPKRAQCAAKRSLESRSEFRELSPN